MVQNRLSYDDAERSTGVYKKSHRKSRLSNPMTKVISYSETPRRNAGLDSHRINVLLLVKFLTIEL
jgi:hypothetical protein